MLICGSGAGLILQLCKPPQAASLDFAGRPGHFKLRTSGFTRTLPLTPSHYLDRLTAWKDSQEFLS